MKKEKPVYKAPTDRWYLERIIWFIAGTVVSVGILLGLLVHTYWFALPLLAGINMLIYAFTGFCPVAVILHGLGVKSRLKDMDGAGSDSPSCRAH